MKYPSKLLILLLVLNISHAYGLQDHGLFEVGEPDPAIGITNLTNPNDEETWVESVLGFSVDINQRYISGSWTGIIGEPKIFSSPLLTEPNYYVVNYIEPIDGFHYYLYENIAQIDYLVIDFSNGDLPHRPGSRITEYKGSAISVDEPNSLILVMLAMGLLYGFYRQYKSH